LSSISSPLDVEIVGKSQVFCRSSFSRSSCVERGMKKYGPAASPGW